MVQDKLIDVLPKELAKGDINYPIVPKTHPPMYSMHKYWARKPHNVVSEYIEHYSKEGDIVLDPFCGSGVTTAEAIRLKRKSIGIDLDPVATFITRCTIHPIDLIKFEESYNEIITKVSEEINKLYETHCPICNQKAWVLGIAWENNKPFEKVYVCEKCGRKRDKLETFDLDKIKEVEDIKIDYWYPKDTKLPPMKKEKLDYVYELFSHRNLYAVSLLYHEIEEIKDKDIKEIMKFVFTSTLPQTTKMMPYVKESIGKICKGWTVHSYWIPPQHWELNVLEYFKLRYNEIKRGKTQSNELLNSPIEGKNFKEVDNEADYFVNTHSALELIDDDLPQKSIIPPNSIDYIFTDPPYGGSIQYFELSVLWASWLKVPISFEDEITINSYQGKRFDRYDRMLKQAFKQVYRVLKPEKYLTVTFHSTKIKMRNSLIRAVVFAGFDMEKIVYQPPAVASAMAKLQPYGSAIGDYYIRFKKPLQEKEKIGIEVDEERYEKVVVEAVKKILAERGEPTPYSYLINFIDVELEKNGLLLGAKTDIKDVLNRYLDKEFILVEENNELVKGVKWWFKDPAKISFLDRIPLDERVEKAIIDVLKSKDKASFDDILQYIFIKFPNSLTPETHSIISYLDTYAVKTSDKRWRLNPDFNILENQHIIIIQKLAEIGKKFDYDVWTAHTNEKISKISMKELVLPIERLDRIKEIDVLWVKENQIKYEFEVENTTQITEAIVRGSNIPYMINRYIIIPDDREKLLKKKFDEPLLKERIKNDIWKMMTYTDLIKFSENKQNIDKENFEKIARLPKVVDEKQQILTKFLK